MDLKNLKIIEEIKKIKGKGTEMISLYIPKNYSSVELKNKIKKELSECKNIKSKTSRKIIEENLSFLNNYFKGEIKLKKNLIFFLGNGIKKIYYPKKNNFNFKYICDEKFFLKDLKKNEEEIEEKVGIILIERKEATLGILENQKIKEIFHKYSRVPSKHRAGGQSSQRFERLIKETIKNFFKEIGKEIDKNFKKKSIKILIFGGPGRTKEEFYKENFISKIIKEKKKIFINTSYSNSDGFSEVIYKSKEFIKKNKYLELNFFFDKFLELKFKEKNKIFENNLFKKSEKIKKIFVLEEKLFEKMKIKNNIIKIIDFLIEEKLEEKLEIIKKGNRIYNYLKEKNLNFIGNY